MTPAQLKSSILQLAIQGKLVPQIPAEGTGEELYQQIQKEKQALIKSGKIKKEKPLPPIAEDEIPFEIPEGWRWCRLDDVCSKTIKRGKSPKYAAYSNTLVFAQKCNTKAGTIDLDIALYMDESTLSKYPAEEFMIDSDIIINSTGNGTLGRVGWYSISDNPKMIPLVPDSHVTIIRSSFAVSRKYIYYCLKYYQPYMEKLGSGSTNQTELSANTIKSLLFPLPPLAEQRRIVAKIEELMPLIDRYDKAWTQLEAIQKKFPGDLKKSILQQAIQGKLVPQIPTEGTGEELYQQIQKEKQALIKSGKIKKEKPLPPIAEDEIPFEIPEGWRWCRLNYLVEMIGDGIHGTPIFSPNGGYYFINGNNLNFGKITIKKDTKQIDQNEYKKYNLNLAKSTILLSINGTIGKIGFYNGEHVILGKSACYITLLMEIMKYYISIILQSDFFLKYALQEATQTTIKNISLKSIRMLPIPLPPLAEQKRIVAKIKELMMLVDKLGIRN